ncbi:MAG: LysR family transcriptional regulator [Pseudomonadota bacterium]|jgi:DNA-binding transcriptional LysR family regulator
MQTLRGILNFTRTADLGSFAAAARELGISAVAVSQNVSRLEARLGVRLLARSTRALTLTPEGEAFLEQCREPLAQLDAACQEVCSDARSARGRVRVSVVSPVAFLYLVPLLPRFYQRHPQIQLDLELNEEASPLIARRMDVGIRVGGLGDAAFVARPLGPMRLLLCASPAYLQSHGVPRSIDALRQHAALMLRISGREHPQPLVLQQRDGGARNVQLVPLPARLACNDFRTLQQACVDGLGIAQLPQPMALPALQAGQLQVLLHDHQIDDWQLFIHYPNRKQLPVRVRAFVDFCIEHLGGHADLLADPAPWRAS